MRRALGALLCLALGGCDLSALKTFGKAQPVQVAGVTLDKTALVLNILPPSGTPSAGFSVSDKLTAVVRPSAASQEIVWTCSNPSLVTVASDGTVSSTNAGTESTVVITATSQADSTKCATASVSLTMDSQLDMEVD